jgi:hypothetical protein
MTRGRPFEPGNSFGRGRPKGSRNKQERKALQILENNSEALMAVALNRCREDPPTLRVLVKEAVRQQQNTPVKINRLALKTLDDLDQSSEKIIHLAIAGKIEVSHAAGICALIESRRRILESQDLWRRVSVVEECLRAMQEPKSPFF